MLRKKSPSPEITTPQNENTSLTMLAIPEGGGAADETEPVKVNEEDINVNGEVKREKGLKRHISK